MRVGEDANEPDYMGVLQGAQLVQLIPHVTVVLDQFCGTITRGVIVTAEDLHSHFGFTFVSLLEIIQHHERGKKVVGKEALAYLHLHTLVSGYFFEAQFPCTLLLP